MISFKMIRRSIQDDIGSIKKTFRLTKRVVADIKLK